MVKFVSCAMIAMFLAVTGCASTHDHNDKACCGKQMTDCCKSGDSKPCCTMPSK